MENFAENIIAIRNRDISKASEAFADLMSLTEKFLNDKVKLYPKLFLDKGGKKMEPVALDALREVAPQTPFRPEEIQLVSGTKFPDIQAERYYGVEVKTTKSNSWKSVGSSIVESTRIEDVSNIYLFFAKLGGEFAEFKCRPYEDCLETISLTHQPRYQIDMELGEKSKESIFKKMNTNYDSFRTLNEKDKIQTVRQYFRSVAKPGHEMSWWIGDSDSEFSVPMTIRFLNDLTIEEKHEIRIRIFILFPEIFSNHTNIKYKNVSLWLCSRLALICSNIRDFFTSAGRVSVFGEYHTEKSYPQIIKRVYDYRKNILALLSHPDEAIIADINELWPTDRSGGNYIESWLDMIQKNFDENEELKDLDIRKIIYEW